MPFIAYRPMWVTANSLFLDPESYGIAVFSYGVHMRNAQKLFLFIEDELDLNVSINSKHLSVAVRIWMSFGALT